MILRIEEAVSLQFESVDIIPGERKCLIFWFVLHGSWWKKLNCRRVLWGWSQDLKVCTVWCITHIAAVCQWPWCQDVPDASPYPCCHVVWWQGLVRTFVSQGEQAGCCQSGTCGAFYTFQSPFPTDSVYLIKTNNILSRALTADLQSLRYKSWALYGTHSFCRGGCQYRIWHKDWTVAMVAAWGGWSQVEALTMFRYFYSPNDNHEYMVDYDRNDAKRVRVWLLFYVQILQIFSKA